MYAYNQTKQKRGQVTALRGIGDADSCGDNPCSAWDEASAVFTPWLSSADCLAYLACAVTGGSVTPDPSNILTLNGGAGKPNPAGGGVQAAQAKCAASGDTWNPLTSTCTPAIMTYVPWILAGSAALMAMGFVFRGR